MQAAIAANTFVVNGRCETKHMAELMPGILSQLSQEQLAKMAAMYGKANAAAGDKPATIPEEDDEQIPDLVGNFEDAAKN